MAQDNTTVPSKNQGDQLTASEFNNVNTVVNANATDAETRLSSIAATNTNIDGRLTTVEARPITILSYTTETLPTVAENGDIAFDTTEDTLVYHRNGAWYKISDNSEVIYVEGLQLVVKTNNTGTSSDTSFTLPLTSGNTFNFTVDWGDGNEDTITTDTPVTHDYGTIGEYSITITGVIQGFKFDNGGDKLKLLSIQDFGDLSFDSDATDAFYGCSNLEIDATTGPDTSNSSDFLWFYYKCSSLTQVPLMDLSSADRYFSMWRDCSSLTSLPNFDFSNGTNDSKYREMFRNCSSITTLDNCTFGDTRSDVRLMFRDCHALTSIPTSLDFTNATTLSTTFYKCESITSFPTISSSNVTNFSNAWVHCSSLTTFPALDMNSGHDFSNAWANCALNITSIENILTALLANNKQNLSTSFSGGTTIGESSWSAQAQADVATLRSRGWTVTTNV